MDLHKKIENAWDLRYDQKNAECLAEIIQIRQTLGFPATSPSEWDIDSLLSRPEQDLILEVLLLTSSLLRAQDDLNASEALLASIECAFTHKNLTASYRFIMEKGLCAFLKGQWALAGELFCRANQVAHSKKQRFLALMNFLFYLENQGLPYQKTLAEIHALAYCPGSSTDRSSTGQGLQAQLEAFRLRQDFRAGQLTFLQKKGNLITHYSVEGGFTQANYFRLWVRALPYQNLASFSEDLLEPLTGRSPYFHNRQFRLRTLQGLLHPDDLRTPKLSELVDRLYLWTWKWLEAPHHFPVQRVVALFRCHEMFEQMHRLTAEDYQLVRNALAWLGLFDTMSTRPLQQILNKLKQPHLRDYPLFEFEWLVVNYFLALRDSDEVMEKSLLPTLRDHVLWNEPGIELSNLVQAMTHRNKLKASSHLQLLSKNLRTVLPELPELLGPGERSKKWTSNQLIVDLGQSRVLLPNGKSIFSEAMVLGLELLMRKKVLSCSELMESCFGIRNYDSIIHQSKMFNLLARIRSVIGSQPKVGVRSGMVFSEGSWSAIEFRKNREPFQLLRQQIEWKEFLSESKERVLPMLYRSSTGTLISSPEILVGQNRVGRKMTRVQLEQTIGKSRSTANRLLAQWMSQGLIKKEGASRSTRYHVSQSLFSELKGASQ